MWQAVRALDSVLRGEATHPSRLHDGKLGLPLGRLTVLVVLLGVFYGFCMGWYSVLREDPQYGQVLASMCKVPLLFLLTLLVTFPSLLLIPICFSSSLTLPLSVTKRLILCIWPM